MPPTTSPYGSWASPITTDLILAESVGLGQIALDGDDVYWVELRPLEAGRQVVVKRTPDGAGSDVTPAPFNVRTRVHEYGGGAYAVSGGRSTSPTSPINGSTGSLSGKSPVPSPRKGTYVTRTSRLIWRARGSSASRRTTPTMGSQSIRWLRSRWTPATASTPIRRCWFRGAISIRRPG